MSKHQEYEGDLRDSDKGCWWVTNANFNAPAFDADHCRKKCVDETLYCEEHLPIMEKRKAEKERR